MSAIAELQAGRAGAAFTAELQRTIRAVAVARNFPPPEGHPAWDADAVWSTASEFMADAQTPRRLADLAVHCASADALRARLQGTVRNFLADIGRRTPIGKLVVRVNDVLRGEDGFRWVGGRWARAADDGSDLAGDGAGDGAGVDDPVALARAIAGMTVVAPAWGHDAHRAAPVADRATIVSLCDALLVAAGGSLTPRALARAIGHRLGVGQAPLSLEVAALDAGGATGAAVLADSTADEALRLRRAAEVVTELNDRERLALAYPELTIRQLAPVLGSSPSQAHTVRARAAQVVRAELLDDDDAEGVALLVMELSRNWADAVDNLAGSAVVLAR
ncbi:MAG: hypothetical protein QOH36_1313 [Actinomycetota bacterium]|nr:hypothetical protein [Actinomycetota bacterium]